MPHNRVGTDERLLIDIWIKYQVTYLWKFLKSFSLTKEWYTPPTWAPFILPTWLLAPVKGSFMTIYPTYRQINKFFSWKHSNNIVFLRPLLKLFKFMNIIMNVIHTITSWDKLITSLETVSLFAQIRQFLHFVFFTYGQEGDTNIYLLDKLCRQITKIRSIQHLWR